MRENTRIQSICQKQHLECVQQGGMKSYSPNEEKISRVHNLPYLPNALGRKLTLKRVLRFLKTIMKLESLMILLATTGLTFEVLMILIAYLDSAGGKDINTGLLVKDVLAKFCWLQHSRICFVSC